jgi:hypothetical protein
MVTLRSSMKEILIFVCYLVVTTLVFSTLLYEVEFLGGAYTEFDRYSTFEILMYEYSFK